MPKRIRIAQLNVTTTPATLYSGFVGFGTVVRHVIDTDEAGGSLGIGHVEYDTDQAGTDAINTMDNTTFDGSVIAVTEDT